MSAADIRAAILGVLHAGPADRGFPEPREGECYHCGIADTDVALLVHVGDGDRIHGHPECGEPHGYRPAPGRTGLADSCRAPEGVPCEPGCPGADPGRGDAAPTTASPASPDDSGGGR